MVKYSHQYKKEGPILKKNLSLVVEALIAVTALFQAIIGIVEVLQKISSKNDSSEGRNYLT